MKTIRKGVFETNSSSTHSITIGSKVEPKNPKIQPLVVDGILYPARLSQREQKLDLGYDDLTTTVCSTKDEKAALLVNWLYYIYYDYEEIQYDEYLEKCNFIRDKCGYKHIDVDNIDSDYYPSDDDRGDIFKQYTLEELLDFVLDDEVKIMDQTAPY